VSKEPEGCARLVIAVGNTLRGDDGVGHRVADLLSEPPGMEIRRVQQLTPELAEALARVGTVVIVDADVDARAVRLERLTAIPQRAPIAHIVSPSELVRLAEQLYGFQGKVYLCRVPAEDFVAGAALTPVAEAGAQAAVRKILELL
jgi:hydrogenase maturation protease